MVTHSVALVFIVQCCLRLHSVYSFKCVVECLLSHSVCGYTACGLRVYCPMLSFVPPRLFAHGVYCSIVSVTPQCLWSHSACGPTVPVVQNICGPQCVLLYSGYCPCVSVVVVCCSVSYGPTMSIVPQCTVPHCL